MIRSNVSRPLAGLALALAGLAASPASAGDCTKLAGLALPDGEVTSAELVPAGAFTLPPEAAAPPPGVATTDFTA